MGSKLKLIIIGIVAFGLVAAAIFWSLLSDRVPLNEPGVVGTSPGNAINGGYFCELDGRVYFSNLRDNHTLYSMAPDETDMKRLGTVGVGQLCGAGQFLYMYMDSSKYSAGKGLGYVGNTYGLYRYRLRDGKGRIIARARPQMTQLCGSYLYFAGQSEGADTGLFKVTIDQKDHQKVSESLILPAGYDGSHIYYAGASGDPSLFSMNVGIGDTESRVFEGNVSSPIPMGDLVYYIDNAAGYKICRYNRVTRVTEVLSQDRVDCYNTDGNYIWYAVSAEGTPSLKRMGMNGSDVQIIAQGVYSNIHVTSRYVYFAPFDRNGPGDMLHVPVGSTGPVGEFAPPMQ